MGECARHRSRRQGGDGRARPRQLPQDLGGDGTPHPLPDPSGAPLPRGAPLRQGARPGGRAADRRPGGGDDDVEGGRPPWRLRRLRPELPRPHDRVCLLDSPRARRARLGAALLGRGADGGARGVHARDDARAREEGGRPHRRDVEAEGQPRFALRAARSRSAGTVGSPFFGRGFTCETVHCSGSLSGRKRRKRVPWRKRAFCHLS